MLARRDRIVFILRLDNLQSSTLEVTPEVLAEGIIMIACVEQMRLVIIVGRLMRDILVCRISSHWRNQFF